jgi:hypothetical protein
LALNCKLHFTEYFGILFAKNALQLNMFISELRSPWNNVKEVICKTDLWSTDSLKYLFYKYLQIFIMIKVFQIAYFKIRLSSYIYMDNTGILGINETTHSNGTYISHGIGVWPSFRISETSMTADRCKQRSCSFYEGKLGTPC